MGLVRAGNEHLLLPHSGRDDQKSTSAFKHSISEQEVSRVTWSVCR